jgi:hypothetical protein
MVFGDIDARKHVRKLVNRFGVDFEATGTYLSDNSTPVSWASASDDIVLSRNVFDELTNLDTPIFEARERVAFKGIGQYLDPSNQFVFPILRAEPTTTSKKTRD